MILKKTCFFEEKPSTMDMVLKKGCISILLKKKVKRTTKSLQYSSSPKFPKHIIGLYTQILGKKRGQFFFYKK